MTYQHRRSAWPSVVAALALVVLAGTLVLAGWLALQEEGPLSVLAPSSQPGVLRLGLAAPLNTLDPTLATSPTDHALQAMLYEGVVAPGQTLAPEPRLAESLPQPSADGLLWTITCRRDVRFHDGQPFTCLDVQVRLESLRAQPDALAESDVDSATLIALLEGIASTEVVDQYALNVHLRAPFAFFNEALAHPAAVIARGEFGTGPFQLESWDAESATLVAFDDYWAGPPELEGVTVQVIPEQSARMALLGETFDVVDDPPLNGTFDGDSQVLVSGPGAQVIYVAVNWAVPPLDDPQIRGALSTAIDPQALASQAYAGHAQPAPLFASPAMPGYGSPPAPQPDLRRAREMQANAGLPDGFDADLYVDSQVPNWQGLAEALHFQLGELYVEGSAEALRVPLEAAFTADPPLPLVVTAHKPPDAYAALAWLAEAPPPEGRNVFGYQNPAFQGWMEQANAALTPEARETALGSAREALMIDPPAVFLVSPDVLAATTGSVSDLRLSPFGWVLVTRDTLLLRR